MFFWKRKPVEPFKPFVRVSMNGLGQITMKYWPHPDMGTHIPFNKDAIKTPEQAEQYARRFLEDEKLRGEIAWSSKVTL